MLKKITAALRNLADDPQRAMQVFMFGTGLFFLNVLLFWHFYAALPGTLLDELLTLFCLLLMACGFVTAAVGYFALNFYRFFR